MAQAYPPSEFEQCRRYPSPVKRAIPAFLLVMTACVAQPPERAALPEVAAVLEEPVGCQISVGAPNGVMVDDVIEGTAADGVLANEDVIVAVDGRSTPSVSALVEVMDTKGVGDPLTVEVLREGESLEQTLTLGSNPADPSSPQIGVLIRTAFDTISPQEANSVVAPSPTARPIGIGNSLMIFDSVSGDWQHTEIEVFTDMNWVATRSGFYFIDPDSLEIRNLITGTTVPDDGFQAWEPRRLIGSLGAALLLVVTAEIPDQPGFVNVAIASFDPIDGVTAWASPVLSGFGIPVAAYSNQDASLFVAVGIDQESGTETGINVFDAGGALQTSADLLSLGSPIGWFDADSVAFRSAEDVVSIHRLADGRTETHPVPATLVDAPLVAAGDGTHMLAINGRDLVLEDIAGGGETLTLAENCSIGRIGEPGWGL